MTACILKARIGSTLSLSPSLSLAAIPDYGLVKLVSIFEDIQSIFTLNRAIYHYRGYVGF